MSSFNSVIGAINDFIWADWTLYVLLLTGLSFTVWSRFSQIRAMSHGTALLLGKYDDRTGPGALRHFQTLSAAISGTVGLGNIGGVAIAVALGGPGAVFWMWVVGFIGMALKFTEVTLSMLYRNTDDPTNPHGGPMWVARKGFAAWGPGWEKVGRVLAVLFCITLILATITGISFFQMWNVANITESYFGIPGVASSIVMAFLVAVVVVGGIRRLGAVAGWLVPFMIVLYIGGGLLLLLMNVELLPEVFGSIFRSAFSPHEATGAFIGGTAGYAFLFGMKRALYSNEAGQGSSPIVHAAARTREPVREGIVAGLEPFIDTIIVCTFSALVILVSGVWNRAPDAEFIIPPRIEGSVLGGEWTIADSAAPTLAAGAWADGQRVYLIVHADENRRTGNDLHRLHGTARLPAVGGAAIDWDGISSQTPPVLAQNGLWLDYVGATLTARAFDTAWNGFGKWLVTIACWLFAYSTMISWIYYGEQGVVYLFGQRFVTAFRIAICALMVLAGTRFVETATEVDALTTLGTGVMLWVNIPLTILLASQAMRAYHEYIRRLDRGDFTGERDK
jgi:AGCS family alanine or glycine:cation symporter